MLATVKALYGYLVDTDLVTGNPAALNRRRLGLVVAAIPSGTGRRQADSENDEARVIHMWTTRASRWLVW
ncbi:hypothetical protein VSH64_37855 [Amycolatopsis rhabdoformis]|uniref:Uncharacterized protein n=1 Tax=Amycolatopsis rhabdoformis TaxID=1448059 RepID=A0ABZ1I4Y5_9PSEU|nr:hypothetical protein [Amycolatopsis rhabdoformis]WSE28553.1 hypothetical protein VSH64_37855 [Amycolatopsis rhabdoformis]